MAVTPRTILSKPGFVALVAASVLLFSSLGLLIHEVAFDGDSSSRPHVSAHHIIESSAPVCRGMLDVLGHHRRAWSAEDFATYAQCFERHGNPRMTVFIADKGLKYHPEAKELYQLKGYYQMALGDYRAAVSTYQNGIRRIEPPVPETMRIQLAWAGLWAPRILDLSKARSLYRTALSQEGINCKGIQTGLWVEYAMARRKSGIEKFRALKKFFELRRGYDSCLEQVEGGDWKTMMENLGAAFLFAEVDDRYRNVEKVGNQTDGQNQLQEVLSLFRRHFGRMQPDTICRHIDPLAETHDTCVSHISEALNKVDNPEVKMDSKGLSTGKNPAGAGGGGGGCLPTY